MEAVGFGLALIAEARTLIKSIQQRIEKYRQGPATFQTLTASLDRLTELMGEVERLLRAAPSALPSETCVVVKSTCTSVHEFLSASQRTMQELTPAFEGGRSGAWAKVKSRFRRSSRANALNAKMSTMETQVDNCSNKLLHLISLLTITPKIQETQDALSKIENLNMGDTSDPVYRRPGTSTPALRHTVVLNFDVRDADGELETPEGKLKHYVLSSMSSTEVTAAAGVMKPAYGVVGMGGVGKTIALQGLGYDEDIRKRFVDGVLYMSLGQDVSLQKVIGEIVRIMRLTGAGVGESWGSLGEVIDEAVEWFSGKECLFLVDDLWPTAKCETGYLRDLQQILRDSPKSRMAVTTRSVEIARDAGLVVHFDARDPTGSVSETLFMKYATVCLAPEAYAEVDDEVGSSVMKILSLCGGLPIALAVTGCGVATLASLHGNFKSACTSYAMQLEKKVIRIGEEKMVGCRSLNAGIILSLECLEGNWKVGAGIEHSMMDLYTSLCVLENQGWIPVSVLCRLWKVDEGRTMEVAKRFGEMSLALLSVREGRNGCSECGLMLHDLQLEFCQREAKEKKTWSGWHGRLLDGYLMVSEGGHSSSLEDFVSFTPREWWCERVPEDDYIHVNVARHLRCSGLGMELGALLLDGRWTHLRVRNGGVVGFEADFEELKKFMEEGGGEEWKGIFSEDVKDGFKAILKSVQHAWGRVDGGERALQFQLCGRLHRLRQRNFIVDTYLKSVEKNTAKPYLVPVNSFFPELYGALLMELPLRGPVTCSPCGRYVAAVANDGYDVVVVDGTSGDVLQRLKGHSDGITSITFGGESTKIVSGSEDKTVVVWKWDQSDSPVRVLEGHSDYIMCVALSRDDGRIFSGSSDCTLRVWDADAGTQKVVMQVGESSKDEEVLALAVCANGGSVAVGLGNGTLKVVDTDTGESVHIDADAQEVDVRSMALSPNGALLATASYDGTVRLWNTETCTRIRDALEGHKDAVLSVAFSPDGQRIVSGSKDGYIRVWSVETGRTIGVSPNLHSTVRSVRFSCDGKRIISGYRDGILRIWDALLDTKREERDYGHSAAVCGVAISEDGMQVVSGSRDGTLRLWDSQTGTQIGVPLKGHTYEVNCVSFSPDGRQVVSSSDDGTVRLWDTESFAQIGDPLQGHEDWVQSVSFSVDGLRLVSGCSDGTVRVWHVATHEQIGDALETGFEDSFYVAETSDGCHIVARSSYESIIWNRERGAIVWRSKGREISTGNEMGDEEAKVIVRSCGQQTSHIWPDAFPVYAAEVYYNGHDVYSNAVGEKTLLGTLPSGDRGWCWRYEPTGKVFAAGLASGGVAICKLTVE